MLKQYNITDNLAPRLEWIESQVCDSYKNNTTATEERISGLLSWLIQSELPKNFNSGSRQISIDVDAFEVLDEPESGGDIGLRYQINSEEFSVATGVVIQAKRFGDAYQQLPSQCYKMLSRTQESYLFSYSEDGILTVPSLPLYLGQSTGGKLTKYYKIGFVEFMCRFLEGFYGDLEIAESVDKPSEHFPVTERLQYIVDIKMSINKVDGRASTRFLGVDRDHYSQIQDMERFL